jgi:Protein of unknown function (DUF2917)
MNVSIHRTHATLLSDPATWLQQVLGSFARPAAPAAIVRHLAKGETFKVEDPQLHDLSCLQGTLWVTQDQDPEDHILERGDRYASGSAVCMLVHAMSDARVVVTRRGRAR